jgi:hypothetical protein
MARKTKPAFARALPAFPHPPRVLGPSAPRDQLDPMVPIGLARGTPLAITTSHHARPLPPHQAHSNRPCCAGTSVALLQGRVCAALCMTPASHARRPRPTQARLGGGATSLSRPRCRWTSTEPRGQASFVFFVDLAARPRSTVRPRDGLPKMRFPCELPTHPHAPARPRIPALPPASAALSPARPPSLKRPYRHVPPRPPRSNV